MYYQITTSNSKPSKSSGSWATSISNQTNAGTYYLWYYVLGDASHYDTEVLGSVSKEIGKGTPSYTTPTGLKLVYKEGISQALITPASTEHGTIQYKIGSTGEWSYDNTNLPSATEKGEYQIYLKINGDANHIDWTPSTPTRAYIVDPVASITTSESVTTLYTDFNNDLINAWGDGSTLQLLKDVQAGSWYTLNNKGNLTLDLNGFGIQSTSTQNYPMFKLQGTTTLTINDSNPSAVHKFNKGQDDDYATLNEANGNITINGGYITGCSNGVFGIDNASASLTMNAGTIIGNYNNGAISLNAGDSYTHGGTFTMNGGAISYNHSNNSGCGVNMGAYTTFSMNGGSITYNKGSNEGVGVRTSEGVTINMHGQPEIRYNQTSYGESSNLYLYYTSYGSSNVIITIDDALDQSEQYRVGVYANVNGDNEYVFTSGLKANSGSTSEYEKFFFADNGHKPISQYYDYEIGEDTEAKMTYSSSDIRLATPTQPTLNANVTYDGSSHAILSAPSISNGGVVKYCYRFRRYSYGSNGQGGWESWSDYSDWYTYESLPKAINAGQYTVKAKAFASEGSGYTDSNENTSGTFTIGQASNEFTVHPTAIEGIVYDGNSHQLVTAGAVAHGRMMYSIAGVVNIHEEIPEAILPGTYTVNYFMDGGYNYASDFSQSYKVTVTIGGVHVYDNVDPSDVLIDVDNVEGMTMTVHRTIYADGEYNTICLPFSMTAEQIAASPLNGYERLKAFRGACVSGTGQDLTIDILVDNATSIEAGVPYLISYPSAHPDIVDPVFTGIEVTTTEPSNVSANGVTFQGMFQQVHIDSYTAVREQDYLFLGSNSQLAWPLDDETSMRGFRAYFIIDRQTIPSEVAPRGTRARIVERTEVPTAISTVQSNEPQSTKVLQNGQLYIIRGEHMYNAQGQMVR